MKTLLMFVVIGLLVVLIFPLYFLVLSGSVGSLQDRAAFGETFGALGALFSALAFAAVTYSIFLQARQLKQQKKEADDALKEQTKATKMNALAILAAACWDEMTWLEEHGKNGSDGYVRAEQIHTFAITEVELLGGLQAKSGLYYEEPIDNGPVDDPPQPPQKPPTGEFRFG